MADITTLTEDTNPGNDTVIYGVDDPAGTPADRKMSIANLLKNPGAIGGGTAAAGTFTVCTGTTSGVFAADITITSGSIVSASGAISFGNEALSTTGTLSVGRVTISGGVSGAVASGSCEYGASSTNGGEISGQGSTNDVVLMNKSGSIALRVAAGTTNVLANGNLTLNDGQYLFWGGTGYGIRGSNASGFITFTTAATERIRIDADGNLTIGTGALATTATDGFLYITSCAGVPTGVPTTKTGRVAMQYDSTNNKLYIYDGSWLSVAVA